MTTSARRLAFALVALLAHLPAAWAGGGPENVFLVVNQRSWASLTVANHFIALRKIPPINVFYVDWQGGSESASGDVFRDKILKPAIAAMEQRGVYNQIDYVVYSSDFPYAIDLAADFKGKVQLPPQATPTSSITSATYLWHLTMLKMPALLGFQVNQYMRDFQNIAQKIDRKVSAPSHGFRSWYGWGTDGILRESGGQPHLLSTMLAMTSGRGNSVDEAVRYLTSAASADGTFPQGTIYFTRTSDVRSTSRQDEVAAAMQQLAKLGVRSHVVSTPMPMSANNVQGLMSGVDNFSWPATRSTILPGAICDNFTSFGGILIERSSQTPLTEFLRYGAAGSAGTVVEPWSIAQKFASPNIFVHYARGCTLAESYYQSLFAPAQVLIVGDPLCRPWANIPQVRASGVEPGGTISGTVTLQPEARFPREGEVHRYELFVDGRRVARAAAGDPLRWDSATECDGYHELRVVAIAAGPIETQGRVTIPVIVQNEGRSAQLAASPSGKVRWDQTLEIAAKAPGCKQIYILNNGRLLGTIAGEQGTIKVDPAGLGLGPLRVQAIAVSGSGYRERVIPPPVDLVVEAATPMPPLGAPASSLVPGLLLRLPDNKIVPVQSTQEPSWLQTAGVGANQPFVFQAYFQVPANEVYQFQLYHYGSLDLAVDGEKLYSGRDGNYQQQFVPVSLGEGLHRITVSGRTGSQTNFRILFGGPGAMSLNGQRFQHPKRG